MTENFSPARTSSGIDRLPPPDGGDSSTKDVAKDQATNVGQGAAQAGQHAVGVAKEQTAQVTAEAGRQAKDLIDQAQGQVKAQAGLQQEKLVSGLRSLSHELGSMSQSVEQPGIGSDLARQGAERTGAIAGWLDGREPAAILDEVSAFARRRPGAFLAITAGVGFLAGRLTRGLKAQAGSSDTTSGSAPSSSTPPPSDPRPTTYPGPDSSVPSPPVPAVGLADPLAESVASVGPSAGHIAEAR
jgi:hypothetical protein